MRANLYEERIRKINPQILCGTDQPTPLFVGQMFSLETKWLSSRETVNFSSLFFIVIVILISLILFFLLNFFSNDYFKSPNESILLNIP